MAGMEPRPHAPRPTDMATLTHRIPAAVLLAVLAMGVASCGDAGPEDGPPTTAAAAPTSGDRSTSGAEVPNRPPDVTGLVGLGDEYAAPPYLIEPSDGYYLGMSLLVGDPVVVRGQDGEPLAGSELREGDEVAVWVDGGCQESFPVQCDVVALQVTEGPS